MSFTITSVLVIPLIRVGRHSSRVNWSSLSKSELSALAKRLHSKRTSREAKIKRMERQIEEFEEDAVIQDETLEMTSDALNKCQKNPKDLKKSLQECFEEMINVKVKDDTDSDALLSRQDTQNLIDFIVEAMHNHTIKLVGNNNFRYLPYLMGLAMNQYF